YQEVINAWLAGLEKWFSVHRAPCTVASVASFFVSRVDSLVDGMLEKLPHPCLPAGRPTPLPKGEGGRSPGEALKGKAAIANAKRAYKMFLKTIMGARFKALQAKGARVQRPLWASTSTKNPNYRDVLYVEELIGPDTVNTLPPATIDAFRDHGKVRQSL